MIDLDKACNVLHVDRGDNDDLIQSLVDAVPTYIEMTTGMSKAQQSAEPLAETLSGFLITLWYYADHADGVALQRTIDSLLKCLTLKAREGKKEE